CRSARPTVTSSNDGIATANTTRASTVAAPCPSTRNRPSKKPASTIAPKVPSATRTELTESSCRVRGTSVRGRRDSFRGRTRREPHGGGALACERLHRCRPQKQAMLRQRRAAVALASAIQHSRSSSMLQSTQRWRLPAVLVGVAAFVAAGLATFPAKADVTEQYYHNNQNASDPHVFRCAQPGDSNQDRKSVV